MEWEVLTAGDKLYHGSVRLYQIQSFISSHLQQIEDYLSTSSFSSDLTAVSDEQWLELVLLHEKFECPFITYHPVSKEVLYVEVMLLLQREGLDDVSVCSVLNELLPANDPDIDDVLNFAYDVEVKGLDIFYVEFYSVMRLPVQFFTFSKEYASVYSSQGKGLKGGVFQYNIEKGLELPAVNVASTAVALGEQVFFSLNPFSLTTLRYYNCALDKVPDGLVRTAARLYIVDMLVKGYGEEEMLSLLLEVCGKGVEELPLYREDLAEGWSRYFGCDLLTPHSLWRLSCWNYKGGARITSYYTDALLLDVMLRDGRYKGYSDADAEEVVVIYPEKYGTMALL